MKFKCKFFSLFLSLIVLLSLTSFNTKETSHVDTKLLKDDFYTEINKTWLESAKIKDGETSVSTASELSDSITQFKKDLFKNLLEKKNSFKKNSVERKIVDFYESFLDTESRNKGGLKPVEKYINQIKSVKTINDLNTLFSDSKFSLYNSLYYFRISEDIKEPTKNILYIHPTSLNLDPDDYTNPNEQSEFIRNELTTYYNKLLILSGYSKKEAKRKVENSYKFQQMIASSIMGQKEQTTTPNIIDATYNVYNLKSLDALAPNLNLSSIMKSIGYDRADKIILSEPKWLSKLNSIYTKENLSLIKDHLELQIIDDAAPYISDEFVKANNDMNKSLSGAKGEISIEEKAISEVEGMFSQSIGKSYVEKHFAPEDKIEAQVLVKQIIDSYKDILISTDTLSTETRKNAIKKLDNLKLEIGYPDKWEDYNNIKIKSYKNGGSLYENSFNYTYTIRKANISSLNKSPNSLWRFMPPQAINAMYDSTTNTILIPFGILQPPFYNRNRSHEENLGAIGSIIAHEISHAFDTIGSQFDYTGKLNNWWTKDDLENFNERTTKFKEFYSKIEYLPGHFVNGDLTVSENIADIGAAQCTLNILDKMPSPNYNKFFESWAKSYRTLSTSEHDLNRLKFDSHSPPKIRVNAVLQQFDKFHETYDIKEGNKMYVSPENRLKVW